MIPVADVRFDWVALLADVLDVGEAEGLNQRELADRVGVMPYTLSRLLNSMQVGSAETAARICASLGRTMDSYVTASKEHYRQSVDDVFGLLQVAAPIAEVHHRRGSIGILRFYDGDSFRVQVVRIPSGRGM